ncbi:hypothetical protein [Vreelandella aquamarina]|uniref:hypothetical protein n=1 Tax=Vreelandella aquamarina TaxID=77097 RepID=UPI001D1936A1|nr:hypothetical protein [Halomonas meridiana]MCC4288514.1 hypothetical protein [Halomonas meridiana]
MSATSRWVYTNQATLWLQTGKRDPYTREPLFSGPHVIACTFENMGDTQTDDNGQQFVPRDTVWHEDSLPIKSGDRIVIGDALDDAEPPATAKAIKKVGGWDMSFFGEAPDFVLYT